MSISSKSLFRATKPKPDLGAPLPFDLHDQRKPEPDQRRDKDFYPTGQPEAIRALMAHDGDEIRHLGGRIWEPACGDGAMVREMRDQDFYVTASDIEHRGCPDSWLADYYTMEESGAPAIITNPPYCEINARDGHGRWLRHTLDMTGWSYLALLLSWDWPAARKNGLGTLLEQNPFSYCYLMRWKLDFTGEGSPPQRNAWFIWRRDWNQVPMQMRFMDREDGRQKSLDL